MALALAPNSASASDSKRTVKVEVGEPDGFSSLTGPQNAVVDVYFGNTRIGDAQITFQPGSLVIISPEKLVGLLPDLVDTAAVLTALSATALPSHEHLVCTPGTDPMSCGRLSPEVAGVIFDQDHFRIDVFVNRHLMAVRRAVQQQYLQQPEPGLSFVNSIGAVLSGSTTGSQAYNVQNNLTVGDADRRLRADLSYASGLGVQADRLVVEMDKPGWRYTAGAFWAPGTDMIGRRKMIGLGVETQIDTRLDKDELQGNPLVVFLNQRSRVDILRDGRVLSSHIYEAGNQNLNTTGLPNGSYEVLLRIEEANGGHHEERRFFTKNPSIAAIGQKAMFLYAGVLADETGKGFLSPTGMPFAQGGVAKRLNPHFAVDGTVLITDGAAVSEIGAYYLTQRAQLRVAAVATSNSAYGGLVQFSSQGDSRLNVNFDLRHIKMNRQTSISDPSLSTREQGMAERQSLSSLPLARTTFTQVSGNVTYNLPSAQFGVSATFRQEKGERTRYSIGPSLRWEFLRRGALRMTLSGDLAITDQGHSAFVGLSLNLLGGRSSLTGAVGVRSSDLEGNGRRSSPVMSVQGGLQDDDFLGAELNLGGNAEHNIDQDLIGATASLRGAKFSFGGDIIQNLGKRSGSTQYSLDFHTSFAARGGTIAFDGRDQSESMVIVQVDSEHAGDQFEIMVNDGQVGTVRGGESVAVALPSYRQYDVRIRQAGGSLVQYDGASRRIGLYPGNVAKLTWAAKPVTAMFGRLLFESGKPVASAAISNPGGISQTDENGYFQIEAAGGSELEVQLPNGRTCRAQLPKIVPSESYAALGSLICRIQSREVLLSSAAP